MLLCFSDLPYPCSRRGRIGACRARLRWRPAIRRNIFNAAIYSPEKEGGLQPSQTSRQRLSSSALGKLRGTHTSTRNAANAWVQALLVLLRLSQNRYVGSPAEQPLDTALSISSGVNRCALENGINAFEIQDTAFGSLTTDMRMSRRHSEEARLRGSVLSMHVRTRRPDPFTCCLLLRPRYRPSQVRADEGSETTDLE